MRKTASVAIAVAMAATLAGCAGGNESEDKTQQQEQQVVEQESSSDKTTVGQYEEYIAKMSDGTMGSINGQISEMVDLAISGDTDGIRKLYEKLDESCSYIIDMENVPKEADETHGYASDAARYYRLAGLELCQAADNYDKPSTANTHIDKATEYIGNATEYLNKSGDALSRATEKVLGKSSTGSTPASAPSGKEQSKPSATVSQSNALRAANSYLDVMGFSRSGLISQLEYEGYMTDDATYAADNCGADWNEQAARSAKEYMDLTAFSRTRLIEQLEYVGYTPEQAAYGAASVGL